jgi:hypothetical protein
MARTLEMLARALEEAEPSEWETIYAEDEVEGTLSEWVTLIRSERTVSKWLMFRFEAGPAGVALPEATEALRRILHGPTRTPEDAYSVIFKLKPVEPEFIEEAGPEVVVAILLNSALAALSGRGQWLGWWLAARAGLAAFALGRPDLAWRVFDFAANFKEPHSQLEKLVPFGALRDEPALARSLWVRFAVWRMWPGLGVPVLPALPMPELRNGDADEQLNEVVERLERAGATVVAGLVRNLGENVAPDYPVALDEHPITRSLVGLAMERRTGPLPEVDALPEGFADWATAQGRRGRVRLMHLAARMLLQHGWPDRKFVAAGLSRATAVEDLPAMAVMFEEHPEAALLLDELQSAASALPRPLADAFIAAWFPRHIDNERGFQHLVENAEIFAEAMNAHPHFAAFVESIKTEAAQAERFQVAVEHPQVEERRAQILQAAKMAAARLPIARAITPEQLESVASRVEVGELTEPLLGRLCQPVEAPEVGLVLSLAISNALAGTRLEPLSRPWFDWMVCRAIGQLEAVRLMPWRNRILDRLIQTRDARLSLAGLYFMRANGHRVQDKDAEAALDFTAARTEAEREESHALAIQATDALNRLSVGASHPEGSPKVRHFGIDPTVLKAQSPAVRARVLQTEARSIRRSNSQEAFDKLIEALKMVEPGTPLHAEIASDAVAILEYLGRDYDGIRLGRSALQAARAVKPCIELAMLQLETGASLDRKGHHEEGLALMRLGLDGLRGHNVQNEGVARLKLLWARGVLPDEEITEHERWLHDHRVDFDADLRRDVRIWADHQKGHRPKAANATLRSDAQDAVVRHVGRDERAEKPAGLWTPPETVGDLPASAWGALTDRLALLAQSQAVVKDAVAKLRTPDPEYDTRSARSRVEAAWGRTLRAVPCLVAAGTRIDDLAAAALDCAGWLAERLLRDRVATVGATAHAWLDGHDAHTIITWLARGGLALQRPLEARFERPAGVPFELWATWRRSLDGAPSDAMGALMEIRRSAPEFLARDADLRSVWRFLRAERGSACVAPFVVGSSLVVALLTVDSTGQELEAVLIADGALDGSLSDADTMRSFVVDAVERRLGGQPKLVLWVPGPSLRSVNPSLLWRDVPVACSLRFFAAPPAAERVRARSTLVVLADPGPSGPPPSEDLGPGGREAFDAIVTAASPFGPVRRMASVGPAFGRTLLEDEPSVRDTPASASDLLAEIPNHDLIVIIAHGECESPTSASLVCIDSAGALQRLDVARLANESEALAGARVVLLSCDSGRIGSGHSNPGGLAGVLLAAGASCVVAPLDRLRVRSAKDIGVRIVEMLCRGQAPWDFLSAIQGPSAVTEGAALGRRAPSAAEQRATRGADGEAFVTWVG